MGDIVIKDKYTIKDDLLYTKDSEWVKQEGDIWIYGISNYATCYIYPKRSERKANCVEGLRFKNTREKMELAMPLHFMYCFRKALQSRQDKLSAEADL